MPRASRTLPVQTIVLGGHLAFLLTRAFPGPRRAVGEALGTEIGRWSDAARLRDAILGQVAENPVLARWRSFTVEAFADNVEGAYVFRNGLPCSAL